VLPHGARLRITRVVGAARLVGGRPSGRVDRGRPLTLPLGGARIDEATPVHAVLLRRADRRSSAARSMPPNARRGRLPY
jgi:hypothetical protein